MTRPKTDGIYAFSDPTGRYREIELDFASDTGLLRTVFVYPWTMTWKDCRASGAPKSTPRESARGGFSIPT